MSEKTLFHHIKSKIDKGRLTRIENLVGEGTPDTNCCIDGFEFWIELKDAVVAKRDTSLLLGRSHKLTPQQVNFWRAQKRNGGYAWVLVRYGSEFFLFDNWLHINTYTIKEAREYSCFLSSKIEAIFEYILSVGMTKHRIHDKNQ